MKFLRNLISIFATLFPLIGLVGCEGGNRSVQETGDMTFEQLAAEADAETEVSEEDL